MQTACYLWVSVVEAQQVYFRANQRFSEMFFSGDELKAHLWEWKLLSGLIWGRCAEQSRHTQAAGNSRSIVHMC